MIRYLCVCAAAFGCALLTGCLATFDGKLENRVTTTLAAINTHPTTVKGFECFMPT